MSALHLAAEEGDLHGVWLALGGARTAPRPKLWMYPAGAEHEPVDPAPVIDPEDDPDSASFVKKTPKRLAEEKAARDAAAAILDAQTPLVDEREGLGAGALLLACQHTEPPRARDEMELIEEMEAGIEPGLPAGWVRTSDELAAVEPAGPLGEEEAAEIERRVAAAVAGFWEDVDQSKEVEANVATKHEKNAAARAAIAARAAAHAAAAATAAADAALAALEYEDYHLHEATGIRLPLGAVPQHPHYEVARLLLARGAALDARDYDGATALLHACRRGDHLLVEMLLAHPRADLMLPLIGTHDGRSDPMRAADQFNHEEVVSVMFPFHRKATKERHDQARAAQRKAQAAAQAAERERKLAAKAAAKEARRQLKLARKEGRPPPAIAGAAPPPS